MNRLVRSVVDVRLDYFRAEESETVATEPPVLGLWGRAAAVGGFTDLRETFEGDPYRKLVMVGVLSVICCRIIEAVDA
jgi:hypothetical protein